MTATPEYPIKARSDVAIDEEWRPSWGGTWLSHNQEYDNFTVPGEHWVEARPKQQPDPKGTVIGPAGSDRVSVWIVTSVSAMQDRTDLDHWEYAGTAEPSWYPLSRNIQRLRYADSTHPIIVRRRK